MAGLRFSCTSRASTADFGMCADFRAIDKILKNHSAERVVMEATGRKHRKIHLSPHNRGYVDCILNPRQARSFAKAIG
ncbi:MAG: hypothetical protein OXC26_23470 [Albidovulum sp.]|nr:hypothetical protein [Albidovulum sp.]